MKYREKILELIFDENDNALFDWIEQQEPLERVEILKEFKVITEIMLAEVNDDSQKENIQLLDKHIDLYQDAYLDAQVAELKLDMVNDEMDEIVARMDGGIEGIRNYIKECIETNAPNAAAMKDMGLKMIVVEKRNGVYDENNWLWLLE